METLTPSDDGNILISRDIPSSAAYFNLQVGILGDFEAYQFHAVATDSIADESDFRLSLVKSSGVRQGDGLLTVLIFP